MAVKLEEKQMSKIFKDIIAAEQDFLVNGANDTRLVVELTPKQVIKLLVEIGWQHPVYGNLQALIAGNISQFISGVTIFRLTKEVVKEKIIIVKEE